MTPRLTIDEAEDARDLVAPLVDDVALLARSLAEARVHCPAYARQIAPAEQQMASLAVAVGGIAALARAAVATNATEVER